MGANTFALRLSEPELMTRRGAVASMFSGMAALAPQTQIANAETCFGKCTDDAERRKAERLAIQTGTSSKSDNSGIKFSDGVQGLIEKSIYNEELALGGPVSAERKAQIAAKVTALAGAKPVRAATVSAAPFTYRLFCLVTIPSRTRSFAGKPDKKEEGQVRLRATRCARLSLQCIIDLGAPVCQNEVHLVSLFVP